MVLIVAALAAAGVAGYMLMQQQSQTRQEQASLDSAHAFRRQLARDLAKDPAWTRVNLLLNNPAKEGDSPTLLVDGAVPDQAALDRLKTMINGARPPIPCDVQVKVVAAK